VCGPSHIFLWRPITCPFEFLAVPPLRHHEVDGPLNEHPHQWLRLIALSKALLPVEIGYKSFLRLFLFTAPATSSFQNHTSFLEYIEVFHPVFSSPPPYTKYPFPLHRTRLPSRSPGHGVAFHRTSVGNIGLGVFFRRWSLDSTPSSLSSFPPSSHPRSEILAADPP